MFGKAGFSEWTRTATAVLRLLIALPAPIRRPAAARFDTGPHGLPGLEAESGSLLHTAAESLWRRGERAPPAGQSA